MANVERDWINRSFVQNVQYNIMRISEFLNKFDTTTRYRLAVINEKLTKLERQMDFLEASISKDAGGGGDDGGEWNRVLDPATNRYFLQNPATGETKWE